MSENVTPAAPVAPAAAPTPAPATTSPAAVSAAPAQPAAASTTVAPGVTINVSPAAPHAPVAPTTAAPMPVAPSPEVEPEEGKEPAWLKRRFEQYERSMLRKLGAENIDEAKDAVAARKQAQEAEKTAAQKAAELAAERDRLKAERDQYVTVVQGQANAALAALTPDRKTVVQSLAGDDPAKVLNTIAMLRPTWVDPTPPAPPSAATTVAPPASPAPVAAPPAVLPPAASTAPAPTAPAPASAAPASYLATLAHLQKTNPLKAAQYERQFAREIRAEEQQRKQSAS